MLQLTLLIGSDSDRYEVLVFVVGPSDLSKRTLPGVKIARVKTFTDDDQQVSKEDLTPA